MSAVKEIKAKDVIAGTVKGALSVTPVTSFFLQVFESTKAGVMKRRFEQWQEEVEKRLSALSEQVLDSLGDNDNFATTLIKATELAAKTSSKKMECLANAVQYAAEKDIDEDTLVILLSIIDRYTLSHFVMLRYFQNPEAYKGANNYMAGSALTYFHDYYPDFDKDKERLIMRNLFQDGLINLESDATMTESGMSAKRTTGLGDKFISFFGIGGEV